MTAHPQKEQPLQSFHPMSDTRYIAIVDDHVMFRKGMVSLINLFPGYTVSLDASNGKDFIKQLDSEKLPDIVLMDINMPEMDGYETTAWVRKNHPAINVLAVSTMDSETSIIKMIKCGAKGYVLKDADPSELKLAFDEVMSRGFFYNENITRKVINSINQFIEEKKNTTVTFANLTEREVEFLKHNCSDMSYKDIGEKMCLSARTVERYRDILCEKLNVRSRVGLALYAIRNNLVVV